MKTIFITLSRGFLARNILQTKIYSLLKKSGCRLVIATPAWRDPDFLREFGAPNVEFIPMETPEWTKLDKIFMGLNHNLIWNRTIRFTAMYGIYDPDKVKPWRLWVQLWFWRPLACLPFLRKLSRWFDNRLCPPSSFVSEQIKKYNPDLVFLTNPMEHWDSFYIKAAKNERIPTVGLVKSWDNMSKTSFRILTDYMLAWGPYMKEEAINYQLCSKDRVFEVGVPQFDIYVDRMEGRSRKEMLGAAHLDPARKTILFGSEGKVTPNDPEIVEGILDMINRQELVLSAQVWVRPHFGYKNDDRKFDSVAGRVHAYIDRENTPRLAFYDQWDYSRPQYLRLADTLHACDVMVTTASTLAIDAAACGKPSIVIAFDGKERLPHRQSVARWYETEYYSNVLATGAVTIVRNFAELRAALNAALENPQIRAAERENLVHRFSGFLDGHASERVADFLLSIAETGKPPNQTTYERS